jgi:TonB family protein
MEKEIVMESTYRQEQLSRWFLPSLLFHLLIIFILFMFEQEKKKPADVIFFDDQEQQQQPIPVAPPYITHQPQQPDEEVPFVINLPKSSTFGATSLVSEETKLAGDPSATANQSEPNATPESEITHDQPNKSQQPKQETTPPETPSAPERLLPTAPLLEPEQKLEPNDEAPAAPPQIPSPQQKRRVKNFWGQAKQSASPINQKMSLTKLAEGFLNYAKETHGTAVDINSKDLSLEPTLQKIGWFLQNSFHLHNKPIALNQDVRTNITLHLEIDEKGSLINSYLSPQTNVPSLDRNLLRIAQGAAPFPPIPPHVMRNKKTFNVKIPIDVDARSGTHEYYFLFRG